MTDERLTIRQDFCWHDRKIKLTEDSEDNPIVFCEDCDFIWIGENCLSIQKKAIVEIINNVSTDATDDALVYDFNECRNKILKELGESHNKDYVGDGNE